MSKTEIKAIAKQFGCTVEQVRTQYRRNAAQLSAMAGAAGKGKLNGFSAAELTEMAAKQLTKSEIRRGEGQADQ
jgi:hypothetical protein